MRSCSRFRNTNSRCDASNLTFAQLGQNRLETAKQYIVQELGKIGIIIDDKTDFNFNAKGTNGDGSSGPNPPVGNKIPVDGTMNNLAPESKRNVVNGKTIAPHRDKSEYDKYKYVRGTIGLVFNDSYEDITPPEPNDDEPDFIKIDVKEYPVFMWKPPKNPFRIAIPGLRVRWDRLFRFRWGKRSKVTYGPPNKKPGETKCEAFGG